MARKCDLTGKKTTSGNNRPFSMKATKRTFKPNLFTRRMFNPLTGKVEKMKLSAKAIKTLKKWAGQGQAQAEIVQKAANDNKAGQGKHVKKEKLTPKQKKELAAQEEAKAAEASKSKVDKEIEAA